MDINREAPIVSEHRVLIVSPLKLVWRIVADIPHWSVWCNTISDVKMEGDFVEGTKFSWITDGLPVFSTLYEIEAPHRLVWDGRLMGCRTICVWRFEKTTEGTQVYIEESFEGALIETMKKKLQPFIEKALSARMEDLKGYAEKLASALAKV